MGRLLGRTPTTATTTHSTPKAATDQGKMIQVLASGSQPRAEAMGKVIYALTVLHVGAALKHQFIDRDSVLSRMVPFLKKV